MAYNDESPKKKNDIEGKIVFWIVVIAIVSVFAIKIFKACGC